MTVNECNITFHMCWCFHNFPYILRNWTESFGEIFSFVTRKIQIITITYLQDQKGSIWNFGVYCFHSSKFEIRDPRFQCICFDVPTIFWKVFFSAVSPLLPIWIALHQLLTWGSFLDPYYIYALLPSLFGVLLLDIHIKTEVWFWWYFTRDFIWN